MANRASEKSYFTFIKGLNTEASPFTFPENSSYDEVNFELLINGARRRRLGLDYEASYTLATTTIDDTLQAITIHEWRDAGGNSTANFVVVQTGRYLRFYPNDTILSTGLHATVIDLEPFKVSTATQAQQNAAPCSMSCGKGFLFVASEYTEPFYISYSVAGAITTNTFVCRMREFSRNDDGLEINQTPTTLSIVHRFNLLNQGWNDTNITAFNTAKSYYPSNAHIMANGWLVNGTTSARTFSATEVDNYEMGNSPAPNGSLITNVFNTTIIYDSSNTINIDSWTYNGTTTVTINTPLAHGLAVGNSITVEGNYFSWTNGTTTFENDTWNGTYTVTSVVDTDTITITVTALTGFTALVDTGWAPNGHININSFTNPDGIVESVRFKATAFYAGRVWFAGAQTNRLATRLFYSQILQDETKIGRFHQEADPTAEEDSAVVDTDGGYLTVPEMGITLKMELFGTRLVIFTTNGVYAISGGSEDYFKATSYSVRKIIDLSIISPRSVVSIDGALLVVAKQGIYQLAEDPTSGAIIGKSVSENTIQTLFAAIPEACLPYVSGVYDNTYKRVLWSYSLDTSYPQRHSRILILDLRLGAWSLYTIPATAVTFVSGAAAVRKVTTKDIKIKYFTVTNTKTKITFSDFTNTSWLDWYTIDSVGTDAAAYVVTGHELVGDVMRKKQVPYLFVYCKRSETEYVSTGGDSVALSPQSSCMTQFWWDFNDTSAGNKFGVAFQAYRYNRLYIPSGVGAFDPGYSIIITKNKVRGVGKAFQVKFYTEAGKDLYLYGWATTFSGYTEV